MRAKIYSFDVFDTCITRPYLVPTDLFRELAKSTLLQAGLDVSLPLIEQLQQLRIDAERKARRVFAELEDISLDQIYQSLTDMLELPIDPAFMQSTEISLELKNCSPISSMQREVADARARAKIVYISDMYLSSDVIRRMLEKCGFWQDGDSLYVSNEVGKSKHCSSLFHHVAIAEGVRAGEIKHKGDNRRADVRMARVTGVRADLYDGIQPTSYEKAVISKFNHYAVRDFIGLNRCIRLRSEPIDTPHRCPPINFVHSVIAPFLIVYVSWVLRKAKLDGRKRLYFVSRDAEIFYKIAKVLASDDDSVDCRYLYGSRKAWFAPSLQRCDRDEMSWAYESIMARTPRAILRRLDLEPDKFATLLAQGGFSNMDEDLTDTTTRHLISLIENSELKDAVLKQATLNREMVLSYFEQEGLFDGTPWSLVDIGWVLNCQTALRRILISRDPDIDVHGYYLGLTGNHIPENFSGGHAGYFAHSRAQSAGEHCDDRLFHLPSVVVLEHLFTPATHGTVVGYEQCDSMWRPVTKNVDATVGHQVWVKRLHDMIEAHAHVLARSNLLNENLDELMPAANYLLFEFLWKPERQDAAAVGWLKTNVEQSHYKEYERSLASALSFRDLMGIISFEMNPTKERYAHPDHAWLNGSAALSNPAIKLAFEILRKVKHLKSLLNQAS